MVFTDCKSFHFCSRSGRSFKQKALGAPGAVQTCPESSREMNSTLLPPVQTTALQSCASLSCKRGWGTYQSGDRWKYASYKTAT